MIKFSILFNVILSLTVSFIIVFLIIPFIIKAARVKKLFAVPNERSASSTITPTLGGISIFVGFTMSTIISSGNINIDELKYLLVGVIVMFIIGLNDDILGSTVRRKVILEVPLAIFLVVSGNFRFTNLHGLFEIDQIGYVVGLLLSVGAFVGIINAYNLIDGIDGLASGLGILGSSMYGIWFLNSGDYSYALASFSLTGSLCAFFMFNVFGTTNKIFMGDTGSLIVGAIFALLTIHFNEFTSASDLNRHGLPAISLAIMIVPIIDTFRVFTIRILNRKSPFSPDMNHIHHQLLRLTNSHLKSSLIIVGINGLIILAAFKLINVLGNNTLFLLLLLIGIILANLPSVILWFKEQKVINIEKAI